MPHFDENQDLSNIPSKLILIALADLMACVKNKKEYVIRLNYLHIPAIKTFDIPGPEGACIVCYAGAYLAGTEKVPKTEDVLCFEDVEEAHILLGAKLRFLDSIRKEKFNAVYFQLKDLVALLNIKVNPFLWEALASFMEKLGPWTELELDNPKVRRAFYTRCRKVSKFLESHGI